MLRRITLLLLLTLPACCGTSPAPTTPRSISCAIPRIPALPVLHAVPCGDQVCLPVDDVKALAKYLVRADGTRVSLEGCSLVILQDE
jgi:hypothetical protein